MKTKYYKVLLIIGFALVFTGAYYVSIVGAGSIISSPETTIKTSIIKTLSASSLEIKLGGSLDSLGLLEEANYEGMSTIMDDLSVNAIVTYDHEINAFDFNVKLASGVYGKSIFELEGFSSEDRIYFREDVVFNQQYYILADLFQGEAINVEWLENLLEDVRKVGLEEYTTVSGRKSYGNLFELRTQLEEDDVIIEALINTKMEIIHVHVFIVRDEKVIVDIDADLRQVNRELIQFDTSGSQLLDIKTPSNFTYPFWTE